MKLVHEAESTIDEISTQINVAELQQKILDSLPKNDEPVTNNDPVVTDDDKKLLDKARRSVAQLQVEIKTIIGFTSDYLAEKYQIKNQDQFNRLFGDF